MVIYHIDQKSLQAQLQREFNDSIESILYWDRDYDLKHRNNRPNERQKPENFIETITTRIFRFLNWILPVEILVDDQHGYIYRYYNPFKYLYGRLYNIPKFLHTTSHRHVKSNIWFSFMMFVCAFSCWYIYKNLMFEINLAKWQPEVRYGANRTDLCAFKSDIYQPDEILYESLADYRRTLLYTLGLKTSPHNVMNPIYTSGCMYIVLSFMTGYIISIYKGHLFDSKVFQFLQFQAQIMKNVRIKSQIFMKEIEECKKEFYPYLFPEIGSVEGLEKEQETCRWHKKKVMLIPRNKMSMSKCVDCLVTASYDRWKLQSVPPMHAGSLRLGYHLRFTTVGHPDSNDENQLQQQQQQQQHPVEAGPKTSEINNDCRSNTNPNGFCHEINVHDHHANRINRGLHKIQQLDDSLSSSTHKMLQDEGLNLWSRYSQLASLVMPGGASYRFRRRYSQARCFVFFVMFPICMVYTFVGQLMIFWEEGRIMLDSGVTYLWCKRWNADAVPIREANFLTDQELTRLANEIAGYRQTRPITNKLASLSVNNKLRFFSYILRSHASIELQIIWINLTVVITWFVSWLCFDLAHMFDEVVMKWYWSKTLEMKLHKCLRALDLLAKMEAQSGINYYHYFRYGSQKSDQQDSPTPVDNTFLTNSNSFPADHNQGDDDVILAYSDFHRKNPDYNHERNLFEAQYKQLESAVVVIYCDFELFRQANDYYQNFNEYFSTICWVALSSITGLMYGLYNQVQSHENIYIVAMMFLTIFLADLFFFNSILVTICYQRVFKQLNELLGKLTRKPLANHQVHLVKKLATRILEDDEVRELYSTDLFGLNLTRSSFISINTISLGALVYLYMSGASESL